MRIAGRRYFRECLSQRSLRGSVTSCAVDKTPANCNTKVMHPRRHIFAPVLVATLTALSGVSLAAHPAEAACTDPPRPGVDWTRCDFSERTFTNIDVSGGALRDARFIRTTFTGANLSGVNAHRAKFIAAVLPKARFDGAKVTEADFTKADLSGASFKGADLRRARLFRANLRGADLTGARIKGADLLNADLSGVRWVDGVTICAEGSEGTCN